MITFENVQKSFNGNIILDNITGSLKSEKINMIIGPSGTGKSVFFKCILGLMPVDNGELYFDGNKMQYEDDNFYISEDSFRKKIGVLQQKPALASDKTVGENIKLYLDILTDLTKYEKIDRVDECLEQVGMLKFKDRFPEELSGGMQKKVGIACAVVHNPKYLFCDEPNSGLDPESSKKIDNLIKNVSKKYKMTTVIISHNLDSVIKIGENIMFLYKGKSIWEGDCKDLFNSDNIELNKFLKSSSMFEKYKKIVLENESQSCANN